MTTPSPHGVLQYLGCLLLGLNGHIVLLTAAALAKHSVLHTHLSNHVLGALGAETLQSPPAAHMLIEPLSTNTHQKVKV